MNKDNSNEHNEYDGCPVCEAREEGFIAGAMAVLPECAGDVYISICNWDESVNEEVLLPFLMQESWKDMDLKTARRTYREAIKLLEKLELISESKPPAALPSNVIAINSSQAIH